MPHTIRDARIGALIKLLVNLPEAAQIQEIVKLRQQLNLSQAVFASVLNVSAKTVQAWEQGMRQPSDAALKLLTIAKKHPEFLLA